MNSYMMINNDTLIRIDPDPRHIEDGFISYAIIYPMIIGSNILFEYGDDILYGWDGKKFNDEGKKCWNILHKCFRLYTNKDGTQYISKMTGMPYYLSPNYAAINNPKSTEPNKYKQYKGEVFEMENDKDAKLFFKLRQHGV